MSLNIPFDGFAYDKDSIISNLDINYQSFFYKNGTASSDSKWNDVRTVENTGYYSCNLGDADWLGQESFALNGAKVLIVFWKGNADRTANCSLLTEWSVLEVTLTGSTVYTQDAQTRDNIIPNLNWNTNIPGHPYVDTTYTVNNSSDDEHSWTFNGIASSGSMVMYHWYQKYGQIINDVNKVDNTDIFWGDGNSSLNIPGAGGDNHWWADAGSYDIDIVIEDACGATVTGTDSFNMYWHEPVPNIEMSPSDPDPNTPVFFDYTGLDVDDRITSIDWIIHDSGGYGNTDTTTTSGRDDTIAHTDGEGTDWHGQGKTSGAFTNPDVHNVEIVIHWNDGFNDQVINYDKDFTQEKFTGPTIDFTQGPAQALVDSTVEFTNTSTNVGRVGLGLPDHLEYEWRWYENGSLTITEEDKPYSYQFSTVPIVADCEIELCADWSDGWETMISCLREPVVFETTVTVTPVDCYYVFDIIGTSNDGSVTGYSWTVASGVDSTGPWSTIWESPVGLDQQVKSLGFTNVGWYKITGYVYGAGTTEDDEVIYVLEVCEGDSTVGVCEPAMVTDDLGNKTMRVTILGTGSEAPEMIVSDVGNKTMRTSGELDGVPIVPNMDVQDVGNKTMRPVTRKACYSYPRPINI